MVSISKNYLSTGLTIACIALLLLLTGSPTALAAPVVSSDIQWTQEYPDLSDSRIVSIQQAPGGGFLVLGEEWKDHGPARFYKLDEKGDVVWSRQVEKREGTTLGSFILNADGSYTFLGVLYDSADTTYTYDIPVTPSSLYVLKTDDQAARQWDAEYGLGDVGEIRQTADGGWVLAGSRQETKKTIDVFGTTLNTFNVVRVIKIDPSGQKEWELTKTGQNGDWLALAAFDSIEQTPDKGYLISSHKSNTSYYGYAANPKYPAPDGLFLTKLDPTGQVQWNKTHIGDYYSNVTIREISPVSDGGYVLAGVTVQGSGNLTLLKVDGSGNLVWNRTYSDGTLKSFEKVPDGGYLLGGYSSRNFTYRGFVVRTDAAGNEQRTWKSNDSLAWVMAVGQTPDNGFYTAGVDYIPWFDSSAYAGHNFTVVKYGPASQSSGIPAATSAGPAGSNGCCLGLLLLPLVIGVTFVAKRRS